MGDMSPCPHGGSVGYCDTCSPGWQEALDDYDDAAFEADEKARIAALHKSAPEVIWLQVDPEAEQFDGWDAQTWCGDKINETDVKYVRADLTPNDEAHRKDAAGGLSGGADCSAAT